ncbi:MAG: tRNA uracil 4-sulfurtransferase ThiI [Calditrichia bacterium]
MLTEQPKRTDKSLQERGRLCAIIHYSEIGLKGKNRGLFENQLRQNILRALRGEKIESLQRDFGRMILFLNAESDWPEISAKMSRIFGIANFSAGLWTEQRMEDITAAALLQMRNFSFGSFRVTVRRAQKEFPQSSQEISVQLGATLQKASGATVDLENPQANCFVEIFNKNALVYWNKIPGPGGLPVGVSEKAVSLLSSGIDSPVASWRMMKRGVKLSFVHFHSMPATSPASARNAEKLVEQLTRFQYVSRLYLVPFLEIQQQIMLNSPAEYRVLLYRRSMFRLAEKIAQAEKASALITGENVGQVASQTLSNIRAIGEVVGLPVLRPLAGDDKRDIIAAARKIGTYRISTEPYEDCCSLYVPRHPETKAEPNHLHKVEANIALDSLYEDALEKTDIRKYKYP